MKSRRWPFLMFVGVAVLVAGTFLVRNIDSDLVYYLTPREAVDQRSDFPDGRRFRLAGVVVEGSLENGSEPLRFQVTDGASTIPVVLTDTPPLLFDEDVNVLLDGAWLGDHYRAHGAHISHHENYQAPPLADDGSR
ncbi:MAG: cytochrome c maturation protein CcmE [Acidimicrobiia bacterium]|nr:cytochrome c maturation protein CcmE [Acidimicrobiia bacterium]